MSEFEWQENARLYAAHQISRRKFVARLVAGGASLAAAVAFVNATTQDARAAAKPRGANYGVPPGQRKFIGGDLYGTPPGHGGVPPGHGGTPPGQAKKNH
jgi:hypothetical protein